MVITGRLNQGFLKEKTPMGRLFGQQIHPLIFQHVEILKLVLTLTASEPWKDAEQTVTLLIGCAFNTILMAQVGLIQQTHTTVVELAQESMLFLQTIPHLPITQQDASLQEEVLYNLEFPFNVGLPMKPRSEEHTSELQSR